LKLNIPVDAGAAAGAAGVVEPEVAPPPNNPPPVAGAAGFDPKRPVDGAVVPVVAVFAVFDAPKRPPADACVVGVEEPEAGADPNIPVPAGLAPKRLVPEDAGGGPAGVVDPAAGAPKSGFGAGVVDPAG